RDGEWLLLLALHHVACDAWSMRVLFGELAELYRGGRLPALRTRYADYAAWQRDRLRGPELERLLRYWRGRLAGMDAAGGPADRARPPVRGGRGARVPVAVPAATALALGALARREGATPFMVLLAVLQALLGRWTGQTDVAVGCPVAGR